MSDLFNILLQVLIKCVCVWTRLKFHYRKSRPIEIVWKVEHRNWYLFGAIVLPYNIKNVNLFGAHNLFMTIRGKNVITQFERLLKFHVLIQMN